MVVKVYIMLVVMSVEMNRKEDKVPVGSVGSRLEPVRRMAKTN